MLVSIGYCNRDFQACASGVRLETAVVTDHILIACQLQCTRVVASYGHMLPSYLLRCTVTKRLMQVSDGVVMRPTPLFLRSTKMKVSTTLSRDSGQWIDNQPIRVEI